MDISPDQTSQIGRIQLWAVPTRSAPSRLAGFLKAALALQEEILGDIRMVDMWKPRSAAVGALRDAQASQFRAAAFLPEGDGLDAAKTRFACEVVGHDATPWVWFDGGVDDHLTIGLALRITDACKG